MTHNERRNAMNIPSEDNENRIIPRNMINNDSNRELTINIETPSKDTRINITRNKSDIINLMKFKKHRGSQYVKIAKTHPIKKKKGMNKNNRNTLSLPDLHIKERNNNQINEISSITLKQNEEIKEKKKELINYMNQLKEKLVNPVKPTISEEKLQLIQNRIFENKKIRIVHQILEENVPNHVNVSSNCTHYLKFKCQNKIFPLSFGVYGFSTEIISCYFSVTQKCPSMKINDEAIKKIIPNYNYKLFSSENNNNKMEEKKDLLYIYLCIESNASVSIKIIYNFYSNNVTKIIDQSPRFITQKIFEQMKNGDIANINKKVAFFIENKSELKFLYQKVDEIFRNKNSASKFQKRQKGKSKSPLKKIEIPKEKLIFHNYLSNNLQILNNEENLDNLAVFPKIPLTQRNNHDFKKAEYEINFPSPMVLDLNEEKNYIDQNHDIDQNIEQSEFKALSIQQKKSYLIQKKRIKRMIDHHRWDLKKTREYLVNAYNSKSQERITNFKTWIIFVEEIRTLGILFKKYREKKSTILYLLKYMVSCFIIKIDLMKLIRKIGSKFRSRSHLRLKMQIRIIYCETKIIVTGRNSKVLSAFLIDAYFSRRLLTAALTKLEKIEIFKNKMKKYVENMKTKLRKMYKFFLDQKETIIEKNFKGKDEKEESHK